jgi:adenylate cyclase
MRFDGGPSSYQRVSALDLLAGRVAAESLRGKVVFIGSSATGLRDHQLTAVDARFPGTQLHAALAENILRDAHLRSPSWAPVAVAAASVGAALALATVFVASSGVVALAATGAVLVLATLAAVAVMHALGLSVPAGAPLLVVAVLFVALLTQRVVAAQRRTARYRRQLAKSRQITIEAMAAVAETRDPETGAHIKRTQHYVRAIAEELRRTGLYQQTLSAQYIDLLFLSAPLHDIGKVGVPDHILLKPGRLDGDEMVEMKKHAEYGRRIVTSSASSMDSDNFLTVASEIAGTHHEKWDGTGYPLGLAGQAIPLSGRIMAVADIYDALISRRCYKEPFPHSVAIELMRAQRGTTFEPAVLDAFFCIEDEIQAIANRYRDDAEEPTSQIGHTPPRSATVVPMWDAPGALPHGRGADAAAANTLSLGRGGQR